MAVKAGTNTVRKEKGNLCRGYRMRKELWKQLMLKEPWHVTRISKRNLLSTPHPKLIPASASKQAFPSFLKLSHHHLNSKSAKLQPASDLLDNICRPSSQLSATQRPAIRYGWRWFPNQSPWRLCQQGRIATNRVSHLVLASTQPLQKTYSNIKRYERCQMRRVKLFHFSS